jgi:16S rRNA (guanine(966)-N(2))-methyltransferase RsmD
MRIIAGQFRGRRLQALPGDTTRPTSDKLRETLFNILAPWMQDAVFIDCYAGTGAVGIEALSRGAREVYLIESSAAALQVIEKNLSWMASREAIHCRRGPVAKVLPAMSASGVRANICFLDPPYAHLAEALAVIETLAASTLMSAAGWIILEHSSRDATPETVAAGPQQWTRTRMLKQGDSALSFYRRGE